MPSATITPGGFTPDNLAYKGNLYFLKFFFYNLFPAAPNPPPPTFFLDNFSFFSLFFDYYFRTFITPDLSPNPNPYSHSWLVTKKVGPGPSNSSVARDTIPEEESDNRVSLGLISFPPEVIHQGSLRPWSPRPPLHPHREITHRGAHGVPGRRLDATSLNNRIDNRLFNLVHRGSLGLHRPPTVVSTYQ